LSGVRPSKIAATASSIVQNQNTRPSPADARSSRLSEMYSAPPGRSAREPPHRLAEVGPVVVEMQQHRARPDPVEARVVGHLEYILDADLEPREPSRLVGDRG
jgi:hypothetical protein